MKISVTEARLHDVFRLVNASNLLMLIYNFKYHFSLVTDVDVQKFYEGGIITSWHLICLRNRRLFALFFAFATSLRVSVSKTMGLFFMSTSLRR